MKIETVIEILENEIRLCKRAPSLNGCEMTEEWQRTIDICTLAVEALREQQVRRMERCNDTVIYLFEGSESACIFVKDINSIETIPADKLDWHEHEDSGKYLTLQEIGEQVRSFYEDPVLYVWVDSPLRGVIYQTGNYSESDAWIEHGTTIGYA